MDSADLVKFANYVNDGESFSGKTIYLAFDIDMTDVGFITIGKTSASAFKGTFDGQGHVIDNLKYTVDVASSDIKYIALFGATANATIKNVVLGSNCAFECVDSANAYGSIQIAALVANMRAGTTIDNVYSMASVTGGNRVGGIVAYSDVGPDATTRLVKNSTNAGTVYCKNGRVGGIVGLTATGLTIDNCRNTGTITSDGTDAMWKTAGGFIGDTWSTDLVAITNSINNGAIKGGAAGGFFAKAQNSPVSVTNCINYGSTEGSVVGGLIAKMTNANTQHVTTDSEDKSQGDETDATLSTVPTITPDFPTAAEIEAEKNSNQKETDAPAETDAPTTPSTQAPSTTAPNPPAQTPVTEAVTNEPTTEEPKGGCGSVILGSFSLMMLLGGAALVVCKKKN